MKAIYYSVIVSDAEFQEYLDDFNLVIVESKPEGILIEGDSEDMENMMVYECECAGCRFEDIDWIKIIED